MTDFIIQKGYPIPEDIRGRTSQYKWGDMEVGDSVFIPLRDEDPAKPTLLEVSGIRVWRVA